MSSVDQSGQSGGLPQKPQINLSPQEKVLFGQLFNQCDPEGLGIVTGEAARPLLEKSNLPPTVLGEIWQIADRENNGFLDQTGFSVALRLLGRAQRGQRIYANAVSTPGPLPILDGSGHIRLEPTATGLSSDNESVASAAEIPPLTDAARQKFGVLFDRAASAGTLDGEKARDIFLKSRLNTETLGQIWTLVDRESKGYLLKPEFVVAMHLIQNILSGAIKTTPATVPREFFAALSPAPAPVAPVPRQGSVASVQGPNAPAALNRQLSSNYGRSTPPVIRPNSTGHTEYQIAPSEKARFDQYFDALNKGGTGLLEPTAVVSFLKASKLPEDVLAQVWDLADVHNTGKFGKAEFSIAMYLTQQKLAGRELPSSLPSSLLVSAGGKLGGAPTGSRQPTADASGLDSVFSTDPTAPTSGPFAMPPPGATSEHVAEPVSSPAVSSSLNDLVGLNDLFASPSPAVLSPPITQASTKTGGSELKAFVPTSDFGQSFAKEQQQPSQPPPSMQQPFAVPQAKPDVPASRSASQATTIHTPAVVAPVPQGSVGSDLLSGDFGDTDTSKQLSSASIEVGNLKNQHRSLYTQTTALTDKRKETEAELGRVLEGKKDLESKIALLRTSYDSEVKKAQQHQELLKTSKSETSKLQREYGVIAASFQAIQEEFQKVSTALESDRQENLAIKEQIRIVTEQNASLQQSLEAAEKEAKQQRNVLAVSKSQLEAAEEEKQKIQAKIAQAKEEAASLAKQIEEADSKTSTLNTANGEANETLNAVVASNTAASSNREIQPASVESERDKYGEFGYGPSYGAPSTANTVPSATANAGDFYENNFATQYPAAANTRTSTHVTEEETQSSPPSSDFAFNHRETSNFPSFILPMDRPPSVTSSVQNNAPLSVRGDLDTSRPESPVFTSEPVSGLVPPESLELQPENEDSRPSYPDHVLTGEEFRANSSNSLPLGSTAAPGSFHETSDSFEFVNAEDSDKGSLEANQVTSATNIVNEAAPEPVTSSEPAQTPASLANDAEEDSNKSGIPSAFSSTAPGAFPGLSAGSATDAVEPIADRTPTETKAESGLSPEHANAQESDYPPDYGATENTTGIPQPAKAETEESHTETPTEAPKADVVQDAADQFPEIAVPKEEAFATESSSKANSAKDITKDVDEDEDSSGDEEGPEEVIPTYRQKYVGDGAASTESDSQSISSYESARSRDDEVDIAAPTAVPQPAISHTEGDTEDIFEPSRDVATPLASSHTSQRENPIKATSGNLDDDFFGQAFNDLSEAQVVTQDEPTDTFADTFDDFENNFNIKGDSFEVPQTQAGSDATVAAPAPATTGTGTTPNSNDEWEQLFAGFGNSGVSNNADFDDAFAVDSQNNNNAVPGAVKSPNSQAVTELVNMGFNQNDAVEALQKHGYNIAEASNYLLDKI